MNTNVLQKTKDLLRIIAGLWLMLFFFGCQPNETRSVDRSYKVPESVIDSQYQVFIETPAGSFQTWSFDISKNSFDTLASGDRGLKSDYLPYPLHAGFIPFWKSDSLTKIPVWILGQPAHSGDTLSVQLLGMIEYRDQNVGRKELLVVPVNTEKQTIRVNRFRDFIISYDPVKFMFETWLKNRHGIGSVTQLKWQDEDKAKEYLDERLNQSDN